MNTHTTLFGRENRRAGIASHSPFLRGFLSRSCPRHRAGLLVLLALASAALGADQPRVIQIQDVLSYVAEPAPYKTYVREFRTPAGLQVLLDSPADHVHHHALMFAVGVDEVDFWGEFPNEHPGKQQPRQTTATETGLSQSIDWLASDNTPLLQEQRRLNLSRSPAAHLLTWRSELRPAPGKPSVKLWGRHYFGLGFRLIREWDGKAVFLFPPGHAQGKTVRGDERVTPADWCACLGTVDDKPVTVVLLADPSNRRHPTPWFTMAQPFAYLSATLGLEDEPLQLAAGQTLTLTYGVALLDGHAAPDRIQQLYQRWKRDLVQDGKDPNP